MNAYATVYGRWPRMNGRGTYASTEHLDTFLGWAKTITIPRFQRGQVWTDSQKLAFGHNFLSGLSPAPVVLWRIDHNRPLVLMDGYQRLSTIGVPLVDESGQPIETRPVLVDTVQVDLTMEPGPGRYSMAELCQAHGQAGVSLNSGMAWMCAHKVEQSRLTVITINCEHAADAMEQFRWLNSGGTPMDPAHLARLGGQQYSNTGDQNGIP